MRRTVLSERAVDGTDPEASHIVIEALRQYYESRMGGTILSTFVDPRAIDNLFDHVADTDVTLLFERQDTNVIVRQSDGEIWAQVSDDSWHYTNGGPLHGFP